MADRQNRCHAQYAGDIRVTNKRGISSYLGLRPNNEEIKHHFMFTFPIKAVLVMVVLYTTRVNSKQTCVQYYN